MRPRGRRGARGMLYCLPLIAVAGFVFAWTNADGHAAEKRAGRVAAGSVLSQTGHPRLTIEVAALEAGRLVIAGKTNRPDVIVRILDEATLLTRFKTRSDATSHFAFDLDYRTENCRITLATRTGTLDLMIGACGPRGDIGPQGQIGPPGAQGETGLQGERGPRGSTGPAGADGAIGAMGPAGPAGPQGDPGPAGPPGIASDMVIQQHTCETAADYSQVGGASDCVAACAAGKIGIAGWYRVLVKGSGDYDSSGAPPPQYANYNGEGRYLVAHRMSSDLLETRRVEVGLLCMP